MKRTLTLLYITPLWTAAIISVILLLMPLINTDKPSPKKTIQSLFSAPDDSNHLKFPSGLIDDDDPEHENDLVFYNKTAFIRHFSNEFSERDLGAIYEKAVKRSPVTQSPGTIRVRKKKIIDTAQKKSFIESFDIRPAPVTKDSTEVYEP